MPFHEKTGKVFFSIAISYTGFSKNKCNIARHFKDFGSSISLTNGFYPILSLIMNLWTVRFKMVTAVHSDKKTPL